MAQFKNNLRMSFGTGVYSHSLLYLFVMGALMGCSVDSQVTDTTRRVTKSTAAPLTGIASASAQSKLTSNGYRVSASLGAPYGGESITTTKTGYKVYSSLQGNISADTTQTTVVE